MATAMKPRLRGSRAAATEPKISSSTMKTIGKPMPSAFSRSSLERSCMPAHRACRPTRWIGDTASSPSRMSAFLRISAAASTVVSAEPVTWSAIRMIGSELARAACSNSGTTCTPSTPFVALTALVIAASVFALSPLVLSKTNTSFSASTPGNFLIEAATNDACEPGTSKPPAVRCLLCIAKNGRASTRSAIQIPRTNLATARDEAPQPVHSCLHDGTCSSMTGRRGNFSWPIELAFRSRARIEQRF